MAEYESTTPKPIRRRVAAESDDLMSVTVRKDDPHQKAGISLVERKDYVYVTKVAENGLFYNSEVEVGDIVLSINGTRIRRGDGPAALIKAITQAKSTVTVVLKKAINWQCT